MSRILLVEDEPHIIRSLTPALVAEGYQVTAAERGDDALAALASEGFDVILLDLGLPDMDGKDVIARVREWSEVPILVLSARHLEAEKIASLDLGADDYVNKPFAMGELMARLRAVLRGRDRRFSSQSLFRVGMLDIDFSARSVRLEGETVSLTPREYDLMRTLARHAGRVVTHAQLVTAVWGGADASDVQTLRVLVSQLRQKIEIDASRPRFVLTEQGIGYRMRDPDSANAGGSTP
ncbi:MULTISPECIES: response regulator transcription factor [Brevundimonas]|jgi:two-component system KDP operon response regulator KdpE|uniref:response regulator transcription factor n=1 Tax=Brevundimonas TaxID=41275 RepID=UPI0002A3F2C3|nr:response regulator transcription factor [Brevundimonas sp.]EKY29758.1 putative KDP operon transcriptional regulatory protein KdpE [Brevundimonas diminuta 470-4]MBN9464144.1 response regulator transcription factor [Brevundimonas sp.]